jgi:hypothetical protein
VVATVSFCEISRRFLGQATATCILLNGKRSSLQIRQRSWRWIPCGWYVQWIYSVEGLSFIGGRFHLESMFMAAFIKRGRKASRECPLSRSLFINLRSIASKSSALFWV